MSNHVTPVTPREGDSNSPVNVDYAELTRLVTYGETLHTERMRLWVMAHAVFITLLGATVRDPCTKVIGWILCLLGILLCVCWSLTVCRISRRLTLLNHHIKAHFANSPHALWLHFWKPLTTPDAESWRAKCDRCLTTWVFTWIAPGLFLLAYLVLALWVTLRG